MLSAGRHCFLVLFLTPLSTGTSPRFCGLVSPLSTTSQARSLVSSWTPLFEQSLCPSIIYPLATPKVQATSINPIWTILPTAFGHPFLFLRTARLTFLPD